MIKLCQQGVNKHKQRDKREGRRENPPSRHRDFHSRVTGNLSPKRGGDKARRHGEPITGQEWEEA